MQGSLLYIKKKKTLSGSLSVPKTEQNGQVHINIFNTRG